jgi:hypothetical protein
MLAQDEFVATWDNVVAGWDGSRIVIRVVH